MYTNWIEIDRRALLHNLAQIRSLLADSTLLMAVVKANAYGHGLKDIVRIIQSKVDFLGVNSLKEAKEASRVVGKKLPILILGYTAPEHLTDLFEYNFRQVVFDLDTVNLLEKIGKDLGKQVSIHLKVETGTNRLGIRLNELSKIFKKIKSSRILILEGLYTHLAESEKGAKDNFSANQMRRLRKAVTLADKYGFQNLIVHLASSAAAMTDEAKHLNMVRVGIALYGLWPSKQIQKGAKIDLQPVLSWKTRVAQIKEIQIGETIGYDRTYRVNHEMRIAVLPVGYYEGLDRRLSNKGYVLVGGEYAKVVGRICMNMTMVDITPIRGIHPGDEVVLIGRQGNLTITADELAKICQTINYEIVSRLNGDIKRIII